MYIAILVHNFLSKIYFYIVHSDSKVASPHVKICENFANYFLKTKANNNCCAVLKCTYLGLQIVK